MTMTEARKEVARFMQPINDVEPHVAYTNRTVEDLIHRWRTAVAPMLKVSTRAQYEKWALPRIARGFEGVPLNLLERSDVREFLVSAVRTDGGALSGKSVRNLRICLRSLLSLGVEDGWIKTNPAAGRLRLPECVPVREKVILTPEQFRRLIDELVEPYSTVVVLAVLSGLRKGELAALRWRCVRPDGIYVQEAVYGSTLSGPKTRAARRRVPAVPRVLQALESWKQRAVFTGPDDFVFAVRTNTPIDLHNAVSRHVKPACEKLGVPPLSWHDLRHTFTTWARRNGVKPEELQKILGHTSVQVTLGIYSHLDDGIDRAMDEVDRYAA